MKIFLRIIEIYRKIIIYKNIVILFKNFHNRKKYKNKKNIHYKVIKNIKDLKKIKFKNFQIPVNFEDRVKNKNHFHFISKKNNLISYGWSSNNSKFYLSEIATYLKNRNCIIFFDFKTLEIFQNKGYYKTLLNSMLEYFKLKDCLIYSLSSNKKSISVILSTGFTRVKKLSFFSEKNIFQKTN